MTPNTFWVDIKNDDFSEGATVKKLSVENDEIYIGDALASFVTSAPFQFAGLQ